MKVSLNYVYKHTAVCWYTYIHFACVCMCLWRQHREWGALQRPGDPPWGVRSLSSTLDALPLGTDASGQVSLVDLKVSRTDIGVVRNVYDSVCTHLLAPKTRWRKQIEMPGTLTSLPWLPQGTPTPSREPTSACLAPAQLRTSAKVAFAEESAQLWVIEMPSTCAALKLGEGSHYKLSWRWQTGSTAWGDRIVSGYLWPMPNNRCSLYCFSATPLWGEVAIDESGKRAHVEGTELAQTWPPGFLY